MPSLSKPTKPNLFFRMVSAAAGWLMCFCGHHKRGNSSMRHISALLLFALAGATLSYGAAPPQVVDARAVLATDAVHAGQSAKMAVVARVQPGYHINAHIPSIDYLIPTRVTFQESPSFSIEKVVYPNGTSRKFSFLNRPISVYEGEIHVGLILNVNASTPPGFYTLPGKFLYQACNDHACLPPTSVRFEASIRVVPPAVRLRPAHSAIFKTINFK